MPMMVNIIPMKEGKCIETLEPCHITCNGRSFVIPIGYRSDGASVPRFLWRLLSPCIDPLTLVPSIAHDYMYEWRIGTRYEADLWYAEVLCRGGYPQWKCLLTFIGLRLFGGKHYGTK